MSNNSLLDSVKMATYATIRDEWESPLFEERSESYYRWLEITSFRPHNYKSFYVDLKLTLELFYAGNPPNFYVLGGFKIEVWKADRSIPSKDNVRAYGILDPADLLILYKKILAPKGDYATIQEGTKAILFVVYTGKNLLSILDMYDEFAARVGSKQLFSVGKTM